MLAQDVTIASSHLTNGEILNRMDEIAQEIGYAAIGGLFVFGWFYFGVKAADSGHNILAWIIGLGPIAILVLGLFGVFRN